MGGDAVVASLTSGSHGQSDTSVREVTPRPSWHSQHSAVRSCFTSMT